MVDRFRGYTLIELLVAMSILILLGGGLVAVLHQGVTLWRTAENRGRVFEQARVVLDRLASDLRSTVIRSHSGDDNAWIRFVCDFDSLGRQRLRFVRSISGETEDPILREGGRLLNIRAPAAVDGDQDVREAREGLLGAPGGLMEVFYGLDPRPGERRLWRGARTPVGGGDSLFHDRNLEGERGAAAGGYEATADAAQPGREAPFAGSVQPATEGVLFLGFGFWGPTTNTWDYAAKPLLEPRPGEKSGPLIVWDSTRAILDLPPEAGVFGFSRRSTSLNDPSDDIFPAMVEVTLVLREDSGPLGARLSENITSSSTSFLLSTPISLREDPRDRFILVEEEWIGVEGIDGRRVTVAAGGRGARETKAASHEQGSRVEAGVTFRRVIEIPGHRRALREVESGRAVRRPR
jgi:prepilin-type N-terminal cleavage/methylation domain-containing protein